MKKLVFPLWVFLTFRLVLPLQAHAQELAVTALPYAPLPLVVASVSTAQSSSQTPDPAQPGQTPAPATQKPSSDEQLKEEEKQRLLGVLPAFNSVESGEAAPLRVSQKFDLWFHSAVDPFTFAVAGIDAGIEQAEDTYPEYNQGALGFAKRFGAAYADSVDGNFWGNAVLPSLLHQDPRYFRLGHGTIKRRLWYATISTVRCKGDNGNWQPNYSNVAGNLISGAISNVYYPAADRGVGLTLQRGLTVTAEGAFGALAFEFYPDAIAYFKRRHHPRVGPAVSPQNPGAPVAAKP